MNFNIRGISNSTSDEGGYGDLRSALDAEHPKYWGPAPGERFQLDGSLKSHIASVIADPGSEIFLAESRDQIIGFLLAKKGEWIGNRHVVNVDMGVLPDFRMRGVCRKLYETFEAWAVQKMFRKVELFASEENEVAVGFYRKLGFATEGRRKMWLVEGDEDVNWLWMAKFL